MENQPKVIPFHKVQADSVQPAKQPPKIQKVPPLHIIKIESYFVEGNQAYIPSNNSLHMFFQAAIEAFNKHYNFAITPDVIWTTILNGLAQHINKNAEKLRKKFVSTPGKIKLEVRRDNFLQGSVANDWMGVFNEFSEKIKSFIGKETHSAIVLTFSTSTRISKACFEIALLDSMQNYFEYEVQTMCGIPEYYVYGTVEDWQLILDNVKKFLLIDKDLKWWVDPLSELINEIILVVKGKPNSNFWKLFIKKSDESGGPYITGAITVLYPYLKSGKNDYLTQWKNRIQDDFDGITENQFTYFNNVAPFVWLYYEKSYKMKFISGLLGITYDKEKNVIKPELGWAVSYE